VTKVEETDEFMLGILSGWENGSCAVEFADSGAERFTMFEESGSGAISQCGSCG
jgi:hypothetical protein